MNPPNAYWTAALAIAGSALLLPSWAGAQRAPGRSVDAVAAPAPASPRRTPSGGVHAKGSRTSGSHSAASASGIGTRNRADAFGFQDLLDLTPNSGFNYQFVNSINQDLPIKVFIDPVTQIEVAQAERLLRSTGGLFGGAYILGGGGYYVPPEADEPPQGEEPAQSAEPQPAPGSQPQVIVLQQAPNQQAAPPSAEAPAEQQLPDEGEFTLVLRNGEQVEAVAFTRANGKIVYITPGGGRLTIAAADLDADATVRVNQERGTPLQLPL
jgi:hypothetical protein